MGFHDDILNSLQEAVFVLDEELRIVELNRAAEEDLNTQERPRAGRSILSVLPWLTGYRGVLEGAAGAGRSCFLGLVQGPDGPVLVRLVPLVRAGRVEGSVLTVDPGGRTAEERELLAFESLDGLISQMAHEIRNPLGGIRGAAQLLLERSGGEYEEYLRVIRDEVDRLSAILTELIDYAAPASPAREPVNIHEVIDRAVRLAGVEAAGVTVERNYDPSLPEVLGDGGRLLQVFLNLLGNARDLLAGRSGKPGRIGLRTRPSPQYVQRDGRVFRWAEVTVSDNGPGIAPGDLDRIFLPYHSGRRGGTGLGLAICRKILRAHDGMIRVESEPGKGASFIVTIPFAAPVAGSG